MVTRSLELLAKTQFNTLENKQLICLHPHPHLLLRALINLQSFGLMMVENFKLVSSNPNPNLPAYILIILQKYGCLSFETKALLISPEINFNKLANVISILDRAHLLSALLLKIILKHEKAIDCALSSIVLLQEQGMLNQINLRFIQGFIVNGELMIFNNIIKLLNEAKILNQENLTRIANSKNLLILHESLVILKNETILTQLHLELIYDVNSSELAAGLAFLKLDDVLNVHNRERLSSDREFCSYNAVSYCLNKAGIFAPHLKSQIKSHPRSFELFSSFYELYQSGILTEAIFFQVIKHCEPLNYALSLSYLHAESINIEPPEVLLSQTPDPLALTYALISLKKSGLLTVSNVSFLKNFKKIVFLSSALTKMQQTSILNQSNFAYLVSHPQLGDFNEILVLLSKNNLLNRNTLHLIKINTNHPILALILEKLHKSNLLNQINLIRILHPKSLAILNPEIYKKMWSVIPLEFLTQNNFLRLLSGSHSIEPFNHILKIFRDISLGLVCHYFMMDYSTSCTAQHLKLKYGQDRMINSIIQEILQILDQRPKSHKYAVAQRCMQRLLALRYHFVDLKSDMSILDLLGLTYLALHDQSWVKLSPEEAQEWLIEALYEIQRGYSFGDTRHDNHELDAPVSAETTFSKLLEKLSKVHLEIKLKYITPEMIKTKFTTVAQDETLNHLKKFQNPLTVEHYQQLKTKLHRLKIDQNLSQIWPDIQSRVEELIWDEFQDIYSGHRDHEDFTTLMRQGPLIQLPDVSDIELELSKSLGYETYVKMQLAELNLTTFTLFSSQDPSSYQECERAEKRLKIEGS